MRTHSQLVFFSIVFGVLAWFSMSLRAPISLSTLIWPAGGVLLGMLMLTKRSRWPLWLLVTSVIHAAIGLAAGRAWAEALTFTLAQVIVAPLIATLWRSRAHTPYTLADLHNVLWFLGLLVAGAFLGGVIVTVSFSLLGVPSPVGNWVASVIADIVGKMIGVPFMLAWLGWSAQRSGATSRSDLWRGLVWLAGLVASTMAVFDAPTALAVLGSTRYELSYLPVIFLVLVALQWDTRGLTFALLVLCAIAMFNTLQGEGPFATPGEPLGVALLELQVYLGAAALLGLLMSAISAEHNRALRQAAALKVRFEAAITCSQHIAYEYDPACGQIVWGGDCLGLLGLPQSAIATTAEFLDRVHPDDRAELQRAVSRYARADLPIDPSPHARTFRFLCGDDQYRMLVDHGAVLPGLDDDVFRVSGLLRVMLSSEDLADRV